VAAGAEWRREWELLSNWYRVSVLEDEKALEMDDGDVCTTIRMYLKSLSCTGLLPNT
jgi:hypothetical protein